MTHLKKISQKLNAFAENRPTVLPDEFLETK